MLSPPHYGAMGSRQTSTFHLYHTCIHTFNTTLTLIEIKKRHNLHCRRVLIQVMNQRTLSCACVVYFSMCVCVCMHVCMCICFFFAQSLYIITPFFQSVRFSKDHSYKRNSLAFPLNGTWCFGQTFNFQSISSFKKCRQLVLRYINFSCVHEL